jgi:hypothetical protein
MLKSFSIGPKHDLIAARRGAEWQYPGQPIQEGGDIAGIIDPADAHSRDRIIAYYQLLARIAVEPRYCERKRLIVKHKLARFPSA